MQRRRKEKEANARILCDLGFEYAIHLHDKAFISLTAHIALNLNATCSSTPTRLPSPMPCGKRCIFPSYRATGQNVAFEACTNLDRYFSPSSSQGFPTPGEATEFLASPHIYIYEKKTF